MAFSSRLGSGYGQRFGRGMGGAVGISGAGRLLTFGPTKLPATFTINSISASAALRYRGNDASLLGWTNQGSLGASGNLAVGSTGADPTFGVATTYTDGSTGVTLNGGKVFEASGTTIADDDGTSDQIHEVAFRTSAGGLIAALAAKYGTTVGLLLYDNPSNGFLGNDAVTYTAGFLGTTTATRSTLYHLMMFIDRNGNTRFYLNGAFITQQATLAASKANDGIYKIGAYGQAGTYGYKANGQRIDLVSFYQAASICSGSTAEQDAIAAARYNLLTVPSP